MMIAVSRSLLVFLLVVSGCAPALVGGPAVADSQLAAEIDAIFEDPEFAHTHWGVLFRSLDTGETIYARNPERLFVPASNVKLLTGAAALETLGPDFRYRTTIGSAGLVRDGTLEGPLVVFGTGDPTFSDRYLTDPRDGFREWADSLRSHGITRVAGGVIAVDTAFVDPTLGSGWAWDDLTSGYSAEFGALQFNEGVIHLEIFPSQTVLEPAVVVLGPPTQYVRVTNDTRTLPPGSSTALRVTRDEAGPGIVVRGEVAADEPGQSRSVAVRDPALYFVSVLRETLRESGIAVEGPAIHYRAITLLDPSVGNAVPLFTYASPPMREVLSGMMKPSQNQIAETVLRTVGREVRSQGSAAGGVAVIDSLFAAWDLDHRQMRVVDGSGLSRYDLLSPALIVELLSYMDRSPYRAEWLETLPIAGRDGTLESRMRDPPLLDQVRAKTGSLGGVRALSGYLTTQSGERIVFSTIINNSLLGAAAADRLVEAALERVAVSR